MNNLISGMSILLLIIVIITLAIKGVLYALATTHWLIVVIGLLMLTNKYTRKVLMVAILISAVLYLITQ